MTLKYECHTLSQNTQIVREKQNGVMKHILRFAIHAYNIPVPLALAPDVRKVKTCSGTKGNGMPI